MDTPLMPGRYPAIVKSYDKATRTCRVDIPGLTTGGDVYPKAEIEYPIGDKAKGSHASEIEVIEGDTVWVSFIGADPRYPIITGWRNPQAGNIADWRRFHHANMELLAEQVMNLYAKGEVTVKSDSKVIVEAPEILHQSPDTKCTGNLTVEGNVVFNGGSVKHGGKEIGKTHTHMGVASGGSTSGPVT